MAIVQRPPRPGLEFDRLHFLRCHDARTAHAVLHLGSQFCASRIRETAPSAKPHPPKAQPPVSCTPPHLADRIRTATDPGMTSGHRLRKKTTDDSSGLFVRQCKRLLDSRGSPPAYGNDKYEATKAATSPYMTRKGAPTLASVPRKVRRPRFPNAKSRERKKTCWVARPDPFWCFWPGRAA
jgi:hypothetical protein